MNITYIACNYFSYDYDRKNSFSRSYLFWVVRGVGLYRLDLIDISKVINRNVSPELILDDPNLGAFLVDCNQFRIIIHAQTEIISISLDGYLIDVVLH